MAMNHRRRKFIFAAGMLLTWAQMVYASEPGVFQLETLPIGAEVTLPKSNSVEISTLASMAITPTDLPQSVSLTLVPLTANAPLRVAVFARGQERVQYIDLKPGIPLIYNFKSLEAASFAVSVMPASSQKVASAKTTRDPGKSLKIDVRSDKPLSVRHTANTL